MILPYCLSLQSKKFAFVASMGNRGLDEDDFEKVAEFFDRTVDLTIELKVFKQMIVALHF